MAKTYDYDAIISLTDENSKINEHLNLLYDQIINLRKLAGECEETFHSKDQGDIYRLYENLYYTIGKADSKNSGYNHGLWGNVAQLIEILNEINSNARHDKASDSK